MVETFCEGPLVSSDIQMVEISLSEAGSWGWNKDAVLRYIPEAGYKSNYLAELPILSFSEPDELHIPGTGMYCTFFRRAKWRNWSIKFDDNIPDCASK